MLSVPAYSQFEWSGNSYSTLTAAEAAMRGSGINVGAPLLVLRRVEDAGGGATVRHYAVKPIAIEPVQRWGPNGYLALDACWGLPSAQAVADCQQAARPGTPLLLGACSIAGYASAIEPVFCCETYNNGSRGDTCNGNIPVVYEKYLDVMGGPTIDCFDQPIHKGEALVCPDGWPDGCTVTRESSPARCTNRFVDSISVSPGYRLSINEIIEQTPSPRASAAADRTVPLTITLTRPTAGGAETQRVTFDLAVVQGSAGMDDSAVPEARAPRPQGWLLPRACQPNTQRPAGKDRTQLKRDMVFRAGETVATLPACLVVSEYSGEYNIRGKCDNLPTCLRTDAARDFNVRIDGFLNLREAGLGNTVVFIGASQFTPSNHWLTPANIQRFSRIVTCWNNARRPDPQRPLQFLDPILRVNDGSLEWGW